MPGGVGGVASRDSPLSRSLALLGPREMSELSPQGRPKRTLTEVAVPLPVVNSEGHNFIGQLRARKSIRPNLSPCLNHGTIRPSAEREAEGLE